VLKASQATSKLAITVRKATGEQASTTSQLTQATESIRRGAVTTSRAVAEQSVAAEQVSKAAADLTRQIATVTKAMVEQAAATSQITSAANTMRMQSEQAARATSEQARTMKEMAGASTAIARDVKLITVSNRNQSVSAAQLATSLADVRRITERNAEGVRQTRGGTAALLKQAETLSSLMGDAFPRASTNGSSGRGR